MSNLPYISSPGNIDRALEAIKRAPVPEKISQDFVKTILKILGGSGDQMTSYLKKIGLAASDGTPSDAYRKFRNPSLSGQAIAQCLREGYSPLYKRNEYAHELPDSKLLGLIVEETGSSPDATSVKQTLGCFKHLKSFASFEEPSAEMVTPTASHDRAESLPSSYQNSSHKSYGINLGYTINLNLPATSDPAVFDAIFRSLKEHMLRDDDA